MVLSRALCALLLVAGCGQSLFDAHGNRRDGGSGDDDDGGGDGDVPRTCPATCVADAARDFLVPTQPWSYLEDVPATYLWQSMTADGTGLAGRLNQNNKLNRCANNPGASACQGDMSGALLVTTSTGVPGVFTAVQFQLKSPDARVVRLIVRVRVPSDSTEHTIRLYRNSREDHLFKDVVSPSGKTETQVQIIVDALKDDRFIVAFEPTGAGGTAALDYFVSDMADPASCQLGAAFETQTNSIVDDLCVSTRNLTSKMGAGTTAPPMLVDSQGPYGELGKVVRIPAGYYLEGPFAQPLVRNNGAVTIQFWVRLVTRPPNGQYAYAFSDLSVDYATGVGLSFLTISNVPQIQIEGARDASGSPQIITMSAPFVLDEWRFVRIVDSLDLITVCVSGVPTLALPVKPGRGNAEYPPYLGKVTDSSNDPPQFDGFIDDVRVISGALPCN